MSTPKSCFQFEDFYDQLPDPGFYPSSIKSARFRRSTNENHMLQVVNALEGVEPAYQLVSDYFVLEGEPVSPSGIFIARRRQVQLYRACRIFPKEGDEIAPAQLRGCRLQVRVEHEAWLGRPQLPIRVVPTEEGVYEVIDGFKRLAGWREQGYHLIPVVVEAPRCTAEHKRLLLLANSPAICGCFPESLSLRAKGWWIVFGARILVGTPEGRDCKVAPNRSAGATLP